MNFSDKLLTTEETAAFLGISTHWVKSARSKPELAGPPYHKIGGVVRYHPDELKNWLAGNKRRGIYEQGGNDQ